MNSGLKATRYFCLYLHVLYPEHSFDFRKGASGVSNIAQSMNQSLANNPLLQITVPRRAM